MSNVVHYSVKTSGLCIMIYKSNPNYERECKNAEQYAANFGNKGTLFICVDCTKRSYVFEVPLSWWDNHTPVLSYVDYDELKNFDFADVNIFIKQLADEICHVESCTHGTYDWLKTPEFAWLREARDKKDE